VTYRAKVVVVTTSEGGAPVRAELGAAARFLPYPDEQASLLAERPERWPGEVRSWLGPGLAVTAYPVSEARLRIEATAPAGAVGAGLEELRRLLAAAAPPLESALKSLSSTSAVHRRPIARSRVRSRVSDAVALTGSAARAMSPLGLNVESQAVLDAAALAGVLSRCQFTGDFSRPALRPYEEARRPAAEGAARLSHDLHRLGLARSGLYARARRAALDRLARSPVLRRKLVRALAGVGEPLALGDRLRVGGLLPLSA
jgi:2-polyprenyl-6-methoxyphenol hydroxylase-like FAD-dependent oxidoreductase